MKRKITNAYDAWWFLHEHPKLNTFERIEITPEQATLWETQGMTITRDPCGKCYRNFKHMVKHALDNCFDIHYTKVNKKKRVVECWLEFGPISYGFAYSGGSCPMAEWDDTTVLITVHDYRLDCGGATFDEALVNMANKVLKYYGDFPKEIECNDPLCGDCIESRAWAKEVES